MLRRAGLTDDNLSTLADFRYKRKYKADNGQNGRGARCNGKKGADLTIRVPRGTVIREVQSGAVLADMSSDEPFVAAKGGNGGWGNSHFATATRQTPRFAKSGAPGEEWEVSLELKLIADFGLSERRQILFDFRGQRSQTDCRRLPFHHHHARTRRCYHGSRTKLCNGGYSRTD